MPRFNIAYKQILVVIFSTVVMLAIGTAAYGQTNPENPTVYPEIEQYRRTLSPERRQAYEEALARYLAEPPAPAPVTALRQLAESYAVVIALPETGAAEIADKIVALQKLSVRAARKKETRLELDCLYRAFMLAFWSEHRDYAKGFELALLMEERLEHVTEDQYPDRRNAYFCAGEVYYLFNDFHKSIELLRRAITDEPARSFTDRANLEARRIMGICYANIGEMDLSDSCFLSVLRSGDMVRDRPVMDAVALSNLGCNAMLRGDYRKALALDLEVLPFLKQTDDYGHIAGMYACQCFCYFGLGEPEKVGPIADSMFYYAGRDTYNRNKRLKQAYSNLPRYNGLIGNIPAMQQYQDSLVAIYKREEAAATSQYLLRAEQQVARNKIQQREQSLTMQRRITLGAVITLGLTLFFLTIILRLYRRQRAAYRALAVKARAWAESGAALKGPDPYRADETETADGDNPMPQESSSDELREIAERLQGYMAEHKPYRDPELTLYGLARTLGVTRNKLSEAVNSASGKSFKLYVNDLRVMEALFLMNANPPSRLSMDQLMERVGFNGRTTFYNSFKSVTGLTPAQYWKSIDYGQPK
ncbi:MAG: helix-turn-helix domain-containing protein [Rikenellaceae bacterium]|nr:helix-turn-helix domain-containing protein [Rikenellaceae bacterium]